MSRVFVVHCDVDYEFGYVLQVCRTMEAAVAYVLKCYPRLLPLKDDHPSWQVSSTEAISIEEWEVT